VGGAAQQAVVDAGGRVEWATRPKGQAKQSVTFPAGSVWAHLSEEDEARYRLTDELDRRWLRLLDGRLLLVYNRWGTVYLVVPTLINSASLESEIEFFCHRWYDYQQAVQQGGRTQERDPQPVMHRQLLLSAARIAALLPYDRQLRLAERGVAGTPEGTIEHTTWRIVRDTYAHFPAHEDPRAALDRRLRDLCVGAEKAFDTPRYRVLLQSVRRAVAGRTAGQMYEGHTQTVRVIVWSPDGTRLASAGDGGKVHVCAANASALRVISGWYNDTLALSWSLDGSRISSVSSGGGVQTWEVNSGVLARDVALDLKVKTFAWSPDGSKVALAGGEEQGRLSIVDLNTGETLLDVALDVDPLRRTWSLSWSPDGTRLATANGTDEVSIWEVSSPGLLPVKRFFSWRVFTVAFATQGNLLALGGEGGNIEVWDLDLGEGTLCGSCKGHTACVHHLSWSPDGLFLASTATDDASLRIWRTRTMEQLLCHQGAGFFGSPFWSPTSRAVAGATQDGTIHVAVGDEQTWQPTEMYFGHLGGRVPATGLSWAPEGHCLASVAREVRINARNFAVHVWFPRGCTSKPQAD